MGHHHHHDHQSFNKAFALAVTMTLGFTIIEAGYALYANSMSLLADAAHNLGDVLGLLLSWLANWLLSLPARKRYSYGFKRTTIIASLANAFILVVTSALIAYESIYKLFHLSEVHEEIVIAVGLAGVFVNGFASLLFMRGAQHDLNIKSVFWHLLADMLLLASVVLSAIVIHYTGALWVDPVVGLAIVIVVLIGTWGLLRDSLHLLLDAVPRYVDQSGILKYLQTLPGVQSIHDLHIWGLSTREVALTAHLVMPAQSLSDADHRSINETLHERFHVNHVTLQVETGCKDNLCHRSEIC